MRSSFASPHAKGCAAIRLHPRRAAGGHRHHRRPRRPCPSRRASGPPSGPPDARTANHLKQLGLGLHNHPTTFWASFRRQAKACLERAADALGGVPAMGKDQVWGWLYQMLPFVEQKNIWELPNDNDVKQTPVKIYFCPSRRPKNVVRAPPAGAPQRLRGERLCGRQFRRHLPASELAAGRQQWLVQHGGPRSNRRLRSQRQSAD